MQARYYDPVIGRFYSNDPLGFRDVHSFNRYAYANNNPYKYVDPDGKIPLLIAAPLIPEAVATVTVVTVGVLGYLAQSADSTQEMMGAYNESAAPDLPTDLVGDQGDSRAGPNKSGNRHTSGPGDSAPPGSLIGENGVFGRPENSSGGASIDIPANGDKPHETLHYEKEKN
ncbi:RHS repeat-associated core domain-containing protein [Pseudoalteromonas sp. T1lg65]|uniref:RHS repeat-associated core domain-containing protein n=1 Tax=Pseudoalteromonas sp. T1lg65 TaxID=2077101 RepID=UPI003F78EAC5